MDTSPIIDILRAELPGAAIEPVPAVDMPTMRVDREHILDLCGVLRDHPDLQFAFMVDVTAVDNLPAAPRFDVVYHFACLGAAFATGAPAPARRLRVKVGVPAEDPRLSTVVPVFPMAAWPERELFDLFGITFDGHPDLRRILMPEDWEGFPLRKDYPVQIRKDTASWEPLQVSAEEFAQTVRAQREHARHLPTGPGH